jgi:NSS family neurotransmitter:Na+ symporter
LIIGFLIATYYNVIAGWTLAYMLEAYRGFGGDRTSEQVFAELLASPGRMILWQSVFLAAALLIVGQGLNRGIERAVTILMPALFLMLLGLIAYAAVAGDFKAGFDFLFSTDFSRINGSVMLAAVSQAFFSIGVGMGLMMAYGAYIPRSVSLGRSVLIIAGADTLVAILAGLMIFPLVFANGLDPAQGPGLVFVTMPKAFANMPGGIVFGMLFFLLLAFAAITSVIAILEPVIAYSQNRWGWKRRKGCLVFGVVAWLLGLVTVFSFNIWNDVTPLDSYAVFAGKTLFDLLDYFAVNVMTPVSGILIALFVGWRMKTDMLLAELDLGHRRVFDSWLFLLRYPVPVIVLALLIQGLNQ